jgi:trehalose 6-phosphate phosphatase
VTDLFSNEGRAALARLMDVPAVFGFDFDGTLAPIQARPEGVAMAPALAERFAALTRRVPVAVITGRSVADVAPRVPGAPRWIVGNHGGEGLPGADPSRLATQARVCAAWRAQLARLGEVDGVFVEDKTYTLCLHYRLAPDREAARRRLDAAARALDPAPHIVTGKCVLNLLPEGSADKFLALAALADLAGQGQAFFIGDDDTDETVFARAPASWVTVRVGKADTAARFTVPDQAAVGGVVDLLLARAARDGLGFPPARE